MNDELDCDVHGHCHEWAYSNWEDGDDFFVVTEYDEDIDGYALVHCGLYRDGKYIDARGSFDTLDDVLDVFDLGADVDDEILTKSEFEEFCNNYGLSLPLNEHVKITSAIKQIIQQKGNNNMRTMNENTKLTLTVGEIKMLIREAKLHPDMIDEGIGLWAKQRWNNYMASRTQKNASNVINAINNELQTSGRAQDVQAMFKDGTGVDPMHIAGHMNDVIKQDNDLAARIGKANLAYKLQQKVGISPKIWGYDDVKSDIGQNAQELYNKASADHKDTTAMLQRGAEAMPSGKAQELATKVATDFPTSDNEGLRLANSDMTTSNTDTSTTGNFTADNAFTADQSTPAINEHTKVTLTIGQIKRLIHESTGPSWKEPEVSYEWEQLTWGDLKKLMTDVKAQDDTIITCGWRGEIPYGGRGEKLTDYYLEGCEEDDDGNNVNPSVVALMWN